MARACTRTAAALGGLAATLMALRGLAATLLALLLAWPALAPVKPAAGSAADGGHRQAGHPLR